MIETLRVQFESNLTIKVPRSALQLTDHEEVKPPQYKCVCVCVCVCVFCGHSLCEEILRNEVYKVYNFFQIDFWYK